MTRKLLSWWPLFLVGHVLGLANWWYGSLRFSWPLANYGVMIIVFAAPALVLWRTIEIKRFAVSLSVSLLLLPWVLVSGLMLISTGLTFLQIAVTGSDPSFEYLHSTQAGASRIAVYRTNGGAMTSFGVAFRHERLVFPGVRVVKGVGGFYPCYDGTVVPTAPSVVELSCSDGATRGTYPSGPIKVDLSRPAVF